MKLLNYVAICLFITLISCGDSNAKKENQEESKNQKELTEDSNLKNAKDCDEFIDQYEEWMDNYIGMLEKYMKNPMDAKLMEEYMKLAQESMHWMNQWNGKLAVCASKEKYEKRFNEISERVEKKMEELGIE